jgi:hypothetical protein
MGCIVPDRGWQSQQVFARPGAHLRVGEIPDGTYPRPGRPAAPPGSLPPGVTGMVRLLVLLSHLPRRDLTI